MKMNNRHSHRKGWPRCPDCGAKLGVSYSYSPFECPTILNPEAMTMANLKDYHSTHVEILLCGFVLENPNEREKDLLRWEQGDMRMRRGGRRILSDPIRDPQNFHGRGNFGER